MTYFLSLSRRYIIFIFITLSAINVFSQKKATYSLLWKISGNGLSKPSYLFGTMHIKDKRVFNFSDSVMLCLQSCSRFALEVHPDTLMSKMFAILQNKDTLRNIDKLLNKMQYDKLAKKFLEKNGYPMGKTDPMLLESLMEPDDSKPDDKVSFIDAYLYGIARTLNKTVFGLEDGSSQADQYYGSGGAIKERLLDLLDDDNGDVDQGKEEMIKIYKTGDLNAIYDYIRENDMLDSVISARNRVMENSMIKYMADGPLFTAVGVAHLPGPEGIINLLRKAGFQVTCVQAGFTGIANTYHIDYMKMNWPEYRDEKMGFSLIFPGSPIKNNLRGIDNIIYPDIANDSYCGLSIVPKGTQENPANLNEVIDQTLINLRKNKKTIIISKKEFLFNKMQCTELLIKNSTGYMRMRLFLANNLLYSLYEGSKLNHLTEPYTERFLNSFSCFPIVQKANAQWVSYTDTTGAFSIKFPGQPTPITKEIPAKIHSKPVTFKLNLFVSTDTPNFKTCLVRYNDYPPGTFLNDKSALFNSLINDFKNKGDIITGPVTIWKDGCEGREIKVILKGGFNAMIRFYIKGNRVYILLKEITQPNLKDNVKDQFFDSFRFTPYAEPQYYTYQPDDASFKVKMVSKPQIIPDSGKEYSGYLSHTVVYFSTNSQSGGLYDLEHSKISPYYRVANIDSLYKKLITSFTSYPDSLLKVDTISVNGIEGRELLTVKRGTNAKKRKRFLVNGDDFYFLSGIMDNSELFDKTGNTFFNSLVITRPSTAKIDLSSSKAEKICNDLCSADSVVRNSAHGALSFYKFTTTELPYIYTALKRDYTDDTLSTGTRCMLIKKLRIVHNDSTVNVLSDLYHNINGKDELKGSILDVLPFVNKQKAYDIYLKLFTTDPPLEVKEAYEIFNPLSDSVAFSAEHFEQILPFIKYDKYRQYILRTVMNISAEKDKIYDKKLKSNYQSIMAYANADMDNYLLLKDSTDNKWSSFMYYYMQVIDKVRDRDFNDKFTARYIDKDPKGIYVSNAIVARINNGLPNKQLLVKKYIDSIGTRYDLMNAYANQNQLDKVPLIYRKPDAFAKLCLYQEISSDDYGSPTNLTLLGNIVKNGTIYYVFKYLLSEREENKELIGITGPYKIRSSSLDFKRYHAYTDYEIVKANWRLQATKMIPALINAYKQ